MPWLAPSINTAVDFVKLTKSDVCLNWASDVSLLGRWSGSNFENYEWTQARETLLTAAISGVQCLDYLRDLAQSLEDYPKKAVEKEIWPSVDSPEAYP